MRDLDLALKIRLDGAEQVRRRLGEVEQSSERLRSGLARMGQALAGAFAVRELVRASDAFAVAQGQVAALGRESGVLAANWDAVFAAAQRAGAGIGESAALVGSLGRNAANLGASAQEVLRVAEAVQAAMAVVPAGSAAASGALLQLSQLFGGVTVQAQEFNSLLDGAPRLVQAIEAGLGKTRAEIRELISQGRLLPEQVFGAILSQSQTLVQELASAPATITRSMVRLDNAWAQFIGQTAEASGAVHTVTLAIDTLAEHLDTVLRVAGVLGAGYLGSRVGAGIVGGAQTLAARAGAADAARLAAAQAAAEGTVAAAATKTTQAYLAQLAVARDVAATRASYAAATLAQTQAEIARMSGMARLAAVEQTLVPQRQALAAATAAQAAAEAKLVAATTAATRGAGLLRGALALLGGPLGMITTALTLGASAWMIWGTQAESALDRARSRVGGVRDAIERLRGEQASAAHGGGDAGDVRARLAAIEEERGQLAARAASLGSGGGFLARLRGGQEANEIAERQSLLLEESRLLREQLRLIEQRAEAQGRVTQSVSEEASTLREQILAYGSGRPGIEERSVPDIRGGTAKAGANVTALVTAAARQAGIQPELLLAVWGLESGFGTDLSLTSSAGAKGPFQMLPGTGARYGVTEHSDFAAQAGAAARYLADLLRSELVGGDQVKALMGYHGGGAHDREWGPKTRGYALAGAQSMATYAGSEWASRLDTDMQAAQEYREEMARVAEAIRRGIDPARELRAELDQATTAYRAGYISADEYAAAQAEVARKLAETGQRMLDAQEPMRAQAQHWLALIDPISQYIAKLDELTGLRRAGLLTEEQYQGGVGIVAGEIKRAGEEMAPPAGDDFSALAEMAKSAAQQIHQAFAEFLYRPWEDGLRGMLESFADMLHKMAAQILAQQAIMAFAGAMGGTAGGTDIWSLVLGSATKMFHSGGLVGRDDRTYPPRQALAPDEVPAILQTGEQVLSRREVAAGYGRSPGEVVAGYLGRIGITHTAPTPSLAALPAQLLRGLPRYHDGGLVTGYAPAAQRTPEGSGAASPTTVRIVNVQDPEVAADWIGSAAGERQILNVLRRNRAAIRREVIG